MRNPALAIMVRVQLLLAVASASFSSANFLAAAESTDLHVKSAPAFQQTACAVRPQDEMWFVSTRHLGSPSWSGDQPAFRVKQYQCGMGWVDSHVDALLHSEREADGQITTVWVHGNRVSHGQSFTDGWQAYRALTCRETAPPLRFVIFSWPSSQIRGPLKDVRVKAARATMHAYYMGWLLARMESEPLVSLIGHSYGARVILGGLHLSAGGALQGRSLGLTGQSVTRHTRVVLLAAAAHNYYLKPGACYGQAHEGIDHLLNLYSSKDTALRFYHLVDKRGKPTAMGYRGIGCVSCIPDGRRRIQQVDASRAIGSTHDDAAYLRSAGLMRRVRQYALWAPVE